MKPYHIIRSGCVLSLLLSFAPMVQSEEADQIERAGSEVLEYRAQDCRYRWEREDETLTIDLNFGSQFSERIVAKVDSFEGKLISESTDIKYHHKENKLSIPLDGKRKLSVYSDPLGRYPAKIKLSKWPHSKIECQFKAYDLTPGQDIFSTHNSGILSGKRNGANLAQIHLLRSARLGTPAFKELNSALENQGFEPFISSRCLELYEKEAKDFDCLTEESTLEVARKSLKSQGCGRYFFQDSQESPMIIYTHIHGFGNGDRGDYAIEEITMARFFGFKMYHPLDEAQPTPLNGLDIFRPVMYSTEKDFLDLKLFDKEDFLRKSKAILSHPDLSFQDKQSWLSELIPSKHFTNPKTIKGMSQKGKQCIQLSESETFRRQTDTEFHMGNWRSLFNILDLILEQKEYPVVVHCYGGRHKTGVLSLGIRYLQDPAWLYGPTKKVWVEHMMDDSFRQERLKSGAGELESLERSKHKKLITSFRVRYAKKSGALGKIAGMMTGLKQERLNPAEQEYAGHNGHEYRKSNVSSMRNLFRLLYEDNPAFEAGLLRHYSNELRKEDLVYIKSKLRGLKQKMMASRYVDSL